MLDGVDIRHELGIRGAQIGLQQHFVALLIEGRRHVLSIGMAEAEVSGTGVEEGVIRYAVDYGVPVVVYFIGTRQ
ncbi:hypothetical protein ES707_20323 [subsurface metagenome]